MKKKSLLIGGIGALVVGAGAVVASVIANKKGQEIQEECFEDDDYEVEDEDLEQENEEEAN